MKKRLQILLPVFILFLSSLFVGHAFAYHAPPWARTIDPVVSTDWLADNIVDPNLVIIDIRDPVSYTAGHIPGAINEPFVVPFSAWITMRDGLLLEVPEVSELFETIGSLGITDDSKVVIVTQSNPEEPPHYGLANATRVAVTLIYAGVKNVAILDGGYPKWVGEGKERTTDIPDVESVIYEGPVNAAMFVSTEYVNEHLKKAVILDARDADVYFGIAIEPFALKHGHIPNARCLPAPWIWELNPEGTYYTYRDEEILGEMASGVIGEYIYHHFGKHKGQRAKEIIVYCGVGGYGSSWWFVLTQMLGYKNVKFYDGSAQAWVGEDYDMVPYQWD